jgi:hypothetical protein
MKDLPAGLVAFHWAGGHLEGVLGLREPGRYQLWPLSSIEERNRDYLVDELAPGYVGIGSDGGGEMIALSPTGEVVTLPFVGMEPKEAIVVAASWSEFESRIKSGGA